MNRPVLNTLQGCAGLAVGDVPGAKDERLGRFGGIAGGAGVAGMKYRSRRAPSFRTATCCWGLGFEPWGMSPTRRTASAPWDCSVRWVWQLQNRLGDLAQVASSHGPARPRPADGCG